MIDHGFSVVLHDPMYAIIGSAAQAQSCDNRDCFDAARGFNARMDSDIALQPEVADIFARLDKLGLRQRQLAEALGIAENKVSKTRKGERQLKAAELIRAREWLSSMEDGSAKVPDQPDGDPAIDYVEIEVLPTYAGMGGGGSGDGDREVALVPRALIVEMLRGTPSDFLLINVRGDSMEPDFHHGDQILVDRRDTSPAQPGPFALWDGEWGEYVVKNVERSRSGHVRIFSSNQKYQAESAEAEATRIIGRPVWFGRRL